ncbi:MULTISPECIES: hypothetical protein [Cupriavidus]|uniref:Glycine-rich protein n=1 Tax=Cupriavidus pinatubonensis (strain JMP 134 / LMG 1197) TaxID=264198 RepID=Q470W1_CUPPJ|nr:MULTISPECIES: hypothetical protein [Cupriavidus]QYY33242.1 hypothetical protein K2O51_21270 [Cupriavidus pinatubonensis]TPQ36887.1 hypothetical protein C2U69_17605 [Cupriavidus pinatubonensis]
MKIVHMRLAAVPLACLAIVIAGCGGGGGDAAPAATAAVPGPGTTTPATTPTAATSALLSGTGDPTPDIGKDGDFYLNTTTGMLFGPKANGVWPAGVSVAGTGSTGTKNDPGVPANTGTAGNTILSGSGDPTATVGNNGDYYINTTTSTLFGPKTDGAWPPGVPLGGGGSGGTVLTGAGAPDSSIGANGDYYLDTTTWTLYGPKANGQWPPGVALAGQPGGSGASGGSGGAGGTGGTDGGTPVGNGNHVLYGTGAPSDSVGVDGDFYYDTSTGTLYGPKASGHWPTTGTTVPTVYNGNFNVPNTLSRGKYVMTGAGGAVALPSDFGVIIPYDCATVTLTASTLGKATGTLNMAVYKVTGSGVAATIAPVGNLSCKISNGQQSCSQQMPAGTVNHNDKLQVQLDTNQATDWGGLRVNLACAK